MSEPFLILHKVAGEPAFDIAIQMKIGDEDGWIIPTSGHRAYPFKYWSLGSLLTPFDRTPFVALENWPIPADWPDHYPVPFKAPRKAPIDLDLLEDLL